MMRKLLTIGLLTLLLSGCGAPDHPTISLYLAVQRGDIDQVERHIYWKTDINAVFPNGRYPVHEAASKGRIILLQLLLKHGAKIDQQDHNKQSALALAILNGRIKAAEILIKAGATFEPTKLLIAAAQKSINDRDVVRFLVKNGADTEAVNQQGDTPLITSIKAGNLRLSSHLIEQGAFVNAHDKTGKSALTIATEIGAVDIQKILLRNGATAEQ